MYTGEVRKIKLCEKSVWTATAEKSEKRTRLTDHKKTDVLIIGGGIAGLLTAYKLKEAGISCIVAEAKTIGSGITKNTTAKITAQHGLIYADIIKRYGAERARLYYQANTNAINDFRILSELYPCDFESRTAFVYTTDNRAKLEDEANAYLKIGIPPRIDDNLTLPIANRGAIVIENQAQFNPLKLLYSLSDKFDIYEETFIRRIDGLQAIADDGSISAKHIILATHYPLINIPGFYFLKLYQHRSYVIALENAPDVGGMYLDEKENGMSFRNYQNLLFIGGGDHKAGHHNKQGAGYGPLRALAKSAYNNATEKYRWATQDCMSLDRIPYVGKLTGRKHHIYVATGFNKWGMTGSMTAAGIIRDLIISGKSEYEALYSPQRSILTKQLAVNTGAAATGLLRLGGPRCSHMGCKLKHNKSEATWDCPCHGSRFNEQGHVIDNPAKRSIRL
jgi:glycine/D-amino acid oxidase-like deaminating enzyme